MPSAKDAELDAVELPPGEDFGIPSDDEDLRIDVQTNTSFDNVVVIDNVPQVEPEKYEKLKGVLVGKLLAQIGTVKEEGFYMPHDPATGKTKGFAFVEFSTPEEAQAAITQLNGYRMDKNHVFSVSPFEEIEKVAGVPDVYEPPTEAEMKTLQPPPAIKRKLHQRLLDRGARDQFIIRYQYQTEIYWNDAKRGGPEIVYARPNWTESFVQWSPRGHLLATMHRQGVALWGGPDESEVQRDRQFQRATRLEHEGVMLIDFSPNEDYVVTWSPASRQTNNKVIVKIFSTRNAALLRGFEGSPDEFSVGQATSPGGGGAMAWPLFKWAGGAEDRYFAKMAPAGHAINVYTAPEMTLLDKKSVKLENIKEFSWSPTAPIMAAFQAESGNLPARICLLSFPGREEVRQKNLFSVADVKMIWHPEGEYLAVRVDQHTKTKKSVFTTFQIFRMKEKNVPIDVLELPRKTDRVLGLWWEPHGSRFAVMHYDEAGPSKARPDVTFYDMEDSAPTKGIKQIKIVGTLKGKPCNRIYWSPRGKHAVLAGLGPLNGVLEFFSVDEFATLNTGEHFMCTDVEWDPTGRYVATVTNCTQQMENGYTLWSFSGKQLYRVNRDDLAMFSWRPRPPTLLTAEQEKKIQKDLKTFSKRYDEEDQALLSAADQQELRRRESVLRQWEEWTSSRRQMADKRIAEARQRFPKYFAESKEGVTVERVEVEEVVSVTEEVVSV